MKRIIVAATSLIVVTSLSLLFAGASQTYAATPPPQALEIAPPVLNLSANPGETVKAEISLRDVSTAKLSVQGEVNDFVAAGEDGSPRVLLDESEPNPYSMRSWFRTVPTLTLNPREVKKLPITIDIPGNAAPGGYYAVVRFTGAAPELDGTGVSLSASLGALVFLTVRGEAKEELSLEEFLMTNEGKSTTLFESAPITFVERIKNSGNIHEQPTGQVRITDMFGKPVAAVNINLPVRNILPGSIRRFEQQLDKSVIGNNILFGRYTAEVKITYGANKQVLTAKKTFWVIPYKLIAIGIIGLILIFFALRTAIKRYNSYIIRQSQKRRRR